MPRGRVAAIVFEVPDVAAKQEEILRRGGREIGELVTLDIPGAAASRSST